MSLHRFSVLFLVIFSSAVHAFQPKECLLANYESEIVHKGKFFGLIQNYLSVTKERCLVTFTHKTIMSVTWSIDVCREPVHIKIDKNGGLDVLKRSDDCSLLKSQNPFCDELRELVDVIQDDGLIFAEGERNNLALPHGRVYCAYQLLRKYLEKGYIFDPDAEVIEFEPKPTAQCSPDAAPAVSPAAPAAPAQAAPVAPKKTGESASY
ncbi:MAG: hypothetical protein JNM93_12605 [Bacteriovoracaceae bacterium]|nr:hypothetical protein [Bacteriovoracaceae bacterium]